MKTVILVGGSGTRLWPLSREYFPKQFLKFSQFKGNSLFQLTFKRALMLSSVEDILIVTNINQKFLVLGEVEELGYKFPEKNILIEPCSKNTLPAITYAMRYVDDCCVVFPSDHMINNELELVNKIKESIEISKEGLVIFGIKPTEPSTGYGYISHVDGLVTHFKEKPSEDVAKEYIAKGYLWNSGIFLLNKRLFEDELKNNNPELYDYFRLDLESAYKNCKPVSIDNGLIERSKRIFVKELGNTGWSDLGTFDSIYQNFEKDTDQNVIATEDFTSIDSNNNLVVCDQKNKHIALCGLDNTIVIDTRDATLICKKNNSQKVKTIVEKLRQSKDDRINYHKTVYRPWGYFLILKDEKNYKVKQLVIRPNKGISLQLHKHRNEHWVIVKGFGKVTLADKILNLKPNEGTYISANEKHKLENLGDEDLEVIEVQTGEYLGEDDIIRF